ncbi:unnamed protein product [Adineta steineri]|uniref:PB1 domain-containing protein n=1 Tax=Adineta steineri TaxID=433720 RepID=A0A813PFZ1_9BILA|nr:unnamed protein product [Adineta steineri]CAF3711840.1 unnamed protein product [Adineta steineri]
MNGSTTTPPPTSSTGTSSDKLSGQLIIKAQLGDDIRKMMIHNEDLTLNELVLMMERIFAGKISNSDELTIKYLDEDGDKITLLNDSDLTVALHFHKILRLFVLVNGNEQINNNSTENLNKEGSLIDAKTFRTELQQIRNSIQTILDQLQLSTSQSTINNQEKEISTATIPTPAVVSSTTREFDPYKHLQNQRSTTPDSIRSKSSTSNKINNNNNNEQKSFQPTSSAPPVDTQHQYHSSESVDTNKAPPTSFQQMPTPHFVPTAFNDQQTKTSPFGAPPPAFPGMPPLPTNAGTPRFPTAFPPSTLPNANTTSAFNPTSAPPSAFNPTSAPPSAFYPTSAPQSAFNPNLGGAPTPPASSNAGQTSTFIGQQQQHQQQQQQQQQQQAPPPQQGGFYGQQQGLLQQRPGLPAFNSQQNNTFVPQQQQQQLPPPSSSSPATINPSFIQPSAMPTPPPLASQQPYGGFPPQNNFFNPGQQQQYPKLS